jgi:DNA (cytosine-5)-methyltransferase 1
MPNHFDEGAGGLPATLGRASVVDLFCGAGGLTHDFVNGGISVNAGIDADPACRWPYETNNGICFIKRDMADLTPEFLLGLYPEGDTKILAGCAPCQPFSKYANGHRPAHRGRWSLLAKFAELARECRPEVVTMENVPQLLKHEAYREFTSSLKDSGYSVTEYLVYCPDYGVPQTRQRLVMFASLFSAVKMAPPTHPPKAYITVRDAIGGLEALRAGGASQVDPMHRCSVLSELNLRRIRASRPGGTWRDWDQELVADCHRKSSGKSYSAVYGRMEWDAPGPTVTTQFIGFGNGRFGHPTQDRAISLREGALLQTFPLDYDFVAPEETVHLNTVCRLVGNAVPVELGRAVARSVKYHLEENYD